MPPRLAAPLLLFASATACGPPTLRLQAKPGGTSLHELLALRAGSYRDHAHVVIELSPGHHVLTQPLELRREHACTSLIGAGLASSFIEGGAAGAPVISLEDVDDVKLSGFSVAHNGPGCHPYDTCGIFPAQDCALSLQARGGRRHEVVDVALHHGLQGFGGWNHTYSRVKVQNKDGLCVAWFDAGDARNLMKSNLMFTDMRVGPCENEGVGFQNVTGATLQHSEVRRAGCAGVRIDADSSRDGASPLNTVQYNKFVDWGHGDAKYAKDMAAVYLYGHWYCPGTVVKFNYAEQNAVQRGGVKCLYFDDAHSDVEATGNVCYGMNIGIEVNGGWQVRVKDTLLVDVDSPGSINCKGIVSNYSCANVPGWLSHLRANNYLKPPWSEQFPWYQELCGEEIDSKKCDRGSKTTCAMLPVHNTVANIVGARNRSDSEFGTGYGCDPFPTAVVEFNDIGRQQNYGEMDVGFVDAAKKNWALKAGSVIYKDFPSFTKIPFEEIGVRPRAGKAEAEAEAEAGLHLQYV